MKWGYYTNAEKWLKYLLIKFLLLVFALNTFLEYPKTNPSPRDPSKPSHQFLNILYGLTRRLLNKVKHYKLN